MWFSDTPAAGRRPIAGLVDVARVIGCGTLRFVALGDSTTVGVGDPVVGGGWRGWARILADQLAMDQPVEFVNLAIAGATVMSVRQNQLDRAVQAGPDLVSLIVGINDTLRSTWDPGRVRDDVLSCVASLTTAGATVMTARFHDHGQVLGLPGLLSRPLQRRIEVVNEAYAAAHRAYGGLHIDLTAEPLVYDRQFWSIDRLHPGELGHRRLAAEFTIGLRTLGFQVEPPSLEPSGGKLPNTWRDLWWLATAGAPWIGRRARDLTPWAARLAFGEATARLAGRAPAA